MTEKKESFLQRSCSAVSTAGKSLRNSCIDNVTKFSQRSASCSRKLNAINCSPSPSHVSKNNILKEETSLISTSRNKLILKEKLTANPIGTCFCSDCATEKDVPKNYIEELEGQLQFLTMKLHEEINNSQLLRRNLLVAKRVFEKEIGDEDGGFDSLLKKATDENWKGRQQIILALKRKLRVLSGTVERIENDSEVSSSRKKCRQKKEVTPEVIPDERKIYWCLEFERQEVFRNAERHRLKIVESRDSLKEALRLLVIRNKELTNEIRSLRKELSSVPVNVNEGLVDRLHEVEKKIKINLEEKVDSRGKLDDLAQQNCRNSKAILQLKEKITLEKNNAKDQVIMLNSLKINEDKFGLMFADLYKEKCKQAMVMKRQLDDVEKDYSKIVVRIDNTLTSITDSKRLMEMLRTLRKMSKANSDSWKSSMFLGRESGISNSHSGSGTISAVEIDTDGIIHLYQNELLEYQAALDFQEHRNLENFQRLYNTSRKTKDEVVSLLKNHYVLEKLRLENKVLKNRLKKFRKVVSRPSQQKLVKKKNSSQQLTETLDEGRMQLNILKTESKFLKVLIKRIFLSKEDDFELLDIFLEGNKDLILKQMYYW